MKKMNIDKYILKNYKEKTNAQMAEELGCSKSTISTHRKHLGISASDLNSKLRNYTQYICEQYGKKTSTKLANELNCSKAFIKKIWRENNVSEKYQKHQLYSLKEKYFENIDSDDKAYFLGFICADGCIYRRNNHQGMLSIGLKDIDIEILKEFKKNIQTEKPISLFKQSEQTTMATLQITSDILTEDLLKLGVGVRKTFDLSIKQVSEQIPYRFLPSFILGYFDGDGSISIPKNDTISKSHISITAPIKVLREFKDILEFFEINSKITIDKRKYKEPFGNLVFTNTANKYLFLKFIYSFYDKSLSRKREKSFELLRRIEENTTNRSENINSINSYKSVVLKWEELLKY